MMLMGTVILGFQYSSGSRQRHHRQYHVPCHPMNKVTGLLVLLDTDPCYQDVRFLVGLV